MARACPESRFLRWVLLLILALRDLPLIILDWHLFCIMRRWGADEKQEWGTVEFPGEMPEWRH